MFRRALTRHSFLRYLRWLWRALRFFALQCALGNEALWRRDFGEQYLSTTAVGKAVVTIIVAFVVLNSQTSAGLPSLLAGALVWQMVVRLLWERYRIYYRNLQGKKWHSLDNGRSILTLHFGINELIAKQYIEPLVTAALGGTLMGLGVTLGGVFWLGSIAMLLKEMNYQGALRANYLNVINQRIQGQKLQNLLQVGWRAFFRHQAHRIHLGRQSLRQSVQRLSQQVAKHSGQKSRSKRRP